MPGMVLELNLYESIGLVPHDIVRDVVTTFKEPCINPRRRRNNRTRNRWSGHQSLQEAEEEPTSGSSQAQRDGAHDG